MLRASLQDYSDACVLGKETITIASIPPPAVKPNNSNKEVIFKTCAPFTDCINEINSTQIHNAKYIDVVMSMYNLIE